MKSSLLLLVLFLISLVTCEEKKSIFTLEEGKELQVITVKKGEEFTIQLEGNPTTGYGWFLFDDEKLKENNLIESINLSKNGGGNFVAKENKEELDGVGGTFSFDFIALNSSEEPQKLYFYYQRPWVLNKNAKPDATFEVFIFKEEKIFIYDFGTEPQTINVKKGEEFSIQIRGNPTTGYNWFLFDGEKLKENNLVKSIGLSEDGKGRYVSDVVEGMVGGVGGTFIFDFLALNTSDEPQIINLYYQRPWQLNSNAEPDATFMVKISKK